MRATFLTIDGIETRVLVAGTSGPTLLLVHGYGSTADLWIQLINRLSKSFRIIAPDLIGHGFTEWRSSKETGIVEHLSDHVLGVADALGASKFLPIGSSLGAIVVADLCIRYRGRALGMIAIGMDASFQPDGLLEPDIVEEARKNGMKALEHPTLASCADRLRAICVSRDVGIDDIALVQMTAYAREDRREAYSAIGDALIGDLRSGAAAVPIERIGVPSLAICGTEDPRASIDVIRIGAIRGRGVEVVALEGCGHLPHLEASDAVAATVEDFCSRLRVGAPNNEAAV